MKQAQGLERFEGWCRKHGLKPLEKYNHQHGEVFIAEGFFLPRRDAHHDLERKHPHFLIFWGVRRGKMDMGRVIAVSAIHHPFKEERIRMAKADVDQWMALNVEMRRYN